MYDYHIASCRCLSTFKQAAIDITIQINSMVLVQL